MHTKLTLIKSFESIANCILENKKRVLNILCSYETYKTAEIEINKTVKALREYSKEASLLKNRIPVGKVAVFLPYNMPLYSLVLYSFGCLLGENSVYVRPSSTSFAVTKELFLAIPSLKNLNLHFFEGTGANFIEKINSEEFSALIFTGKWDSVLEIESQINTEKTKLIYCGSGICPLIIRKGADLDSAAQIAVESKIFNTSQDCLCYENFFVEEEIYDSFVDVLIAKLKNCVIGENASENTDFGTMTSRKMIDYATGILSESKGKRLYGKDPYGCRISPIVMEVDYDDILVSTEKFSPIFTLIKFSDDETLCAYINSREYALGIGICGEMFPDGTFPNHTIIASNETLFGKEDAHIAFGGRKRSGFIIHKSVRRDGPFLFSVETTTSLEDNE